MSEWVDGLAKCPYNPMANTTAMICRSGEYFVGGPTDFSGSDAAVYRSSLGPGERRTVLRTNQYNSKWLNEPQFVGSFETDKFVYFVFREAAVEYINCGKVCWMLLQSYKALTISYQLSVEINSLYYSPRIDHSSPTQVQ